MGGILLVDDDPAVRDSIGAVLADEGLRVRPAKDGAEALALAEAERPDLVVPEIEAIATAELIELIPDLLEALGGEQVMGQGAAPSQPASADESVRPPTGPHPAADHAPPWDA
mgnify:CR=1 FL=1